MKTKISLLALFVFSAFSAFSQSSNNNFVELFNGKNLTGWAASENASSFKVQNRTIVCSGPRSHLFYTGGKPFKNFELVTEIKTEKAANSGIFFHTALQQNGWLDKGYEVQVNNTHVGEGNYRETKKTGSLYGVRNVYYPIVKDGEWFKMRIKVIENHVSIFVNDMQVVDYIQPEKPWRSSARKGWVLGEGLFALQAHDKGSTAYYKSVKVRRLPDGEKTPMKVDAAWDSTITKLMDKGFPVVDYHVHLKGGLTLEQAKENSLKLGINYGIAPNCGLHFPVTDDASLELYMNSVKGQPIFRGMQAEGREWVTMFSPAAVAKFDYVFSDAMTFTDYKGRRNRIWLADEVWVDDKQQFMEQMIEKIEAILLKEPVDIYANPTMLPDVLLPEYEQLWTKERMERVVKVLAANNIALEINSRYKIPNAAMIKMAKKAGVKFTLGTNNNTSDLGLLEYGFKMIEECNLQPDDIFIPKPQSQKPVVVKGLPNKISG